MLCGDCSEVDWRLSGDVTLLVGSLMSIGADELLRDDRKGDGDAWDRRGGGIGGVGEV